MLISTLTGALWLMHGQRKLDLLLLAIALPSIYYGYGYPFFS